MAPGYWMHETSGVLRPAIEAYLAGGTMTPAQVATMRAYLRQWIADPRWCGDDLDWLRGAVSDLENRGQIKVWLDVAMDVGIDPL